MRIAYLLLILTSLHIAWPGAARAERQPHILYILADDLGWKDVGYHGSDIKTPQIDRLAENGARFDQFYVQPMCTPTRAALMTGRYPMRYGLQTGVILSGFGYGLAQDERLLPQALKEAGYKTAIIGKWHLGHADRAYWPNQRGFDYHYGAMLGEIDYFTHSAHDVRDWYRDNKPVHEKGYVTQLLGDDAVRLIDNHDPNTPLFLYLAFTAPHSPYQAPQEYLDRYKAIEDPTRRAYAAMIACMDDQIGRVIDALEKRGMRKNTLIFFSSDNGGSIDPLFAGEGDVSKLKLPADNGPYRNGKGTLYEGGVRVPAFANWPGRVKPADVKQMLHIVDIYPTIIKLAGGSTNGAKPLDGSDVWPTISEGVPSPRTEVVYNIEPFRGAVREMDWKLIWRTPLPSAVELFNVVQDPSEKHDLAVHYPGKVSELQKRIEELARQSQKPLFLQASFTGLKGLLAVPPLFPAEQSLPTEEP